MNIKLNKQNLIIVSLILAFSIFLSGCSEVKNTTVKKSISTPTTNVTTTNVTNNIVTESFTNKKFKEDASIIYKQSKKGWEDKKYTISYAQGKSLAFSEKYKSLSGLTKYEIRVYEEILELNTTTYNYFKWSSEGLYLEEIPAMKIKIETLLEKYSIIFAE